MGARAEAGERALPLLHPDEADLYRDLVEDALGPSVCLEQGRVRFSAVEEALNQPRA